MELDYKKLGSRLRDYRQLKNLTQEELAECVNLSNVYISHIERGLTKTSLGTLVRICNVLSTTPDMLLFDSLEVNSRAATDEYFHRIDACSVEDRNLIFGIIDLFAQRNNKS